MTQSLPSTQEFLAILDELLIPMAKIDRTIKLPFNLRRWENDAEHSYFLATIGCALARQLDDSLDLGKISQYALVHDLVEVHAGDTTIWAPQAWLDSKPAREAEALERIRQRFGVVFPWITETIESYERLDEPESRFVYSLDKILPIAIIRLSGHQPIRRAPQAHREKEAVARRKIACYPPLLEYFDDLCASLA